MDDESDSLEARRAFEYVRPERRRALVRVLLRSDGARTVDELADEVASERSSSDDGFDGEELDRVRIALLHTDLPKLDEGDVVRFDYDAETVVPTDRLDALESYLPE